MSELPKNQKTLNPYLPSENRLNSGKSKSIPRSSASQNKNEPSPNKTINSSQGSNMHPISSQKLGKSFNNNVTKRAVNNDFFEKPKFYTPNSNYMQVG